MPDLHRTRIELRGGDGSRPLPDHVHAVIAGWCEFGTGHEDLRKPYSLHEVTTNARGLMLAVNTVTYSATEALLQSVADSGLVRLGRQEFTVDRAVVVEESSWEDILDAAADVAEGSFRFDSPTVFRSGRSDTVMPTPGLVFGHLRAVWSEWAPPSLRPVIDLADTPIMVTSLQGETRTWPARRRQYPGFVGSVTFGLGNVPRRDRMVLDSLGRLAEYAGVGANTTVGMGRTVYRSGGRDRRKATR